MRPVWRNMLWLGLAGTCGVAGAAAGLNYGTTMGIETATALHVSHGAVEAIEAADLALDLLEQPIPDQRRRYVDLQLRDSMSYLGSSQSTLAGWWTCPHSGAATLARAQAYLKSHPPRGASTFHPDIEKAFSLCNSAQS